MSHYRLLFPLKLEDISYFLEELGEGLTFIKNEYKIKIDDRIIAREYEFV